MGYPMTYPRVIGRILALLDVVEACYRYRGVLPHDVVDAILPPHRRRGAR